MEQARVLFKLHLIFYYRRGAWSADLSDALCKWVEPAGNATLKSKAITYEPLKQ
jgi:hypothetical protein